mmetsp:Transcript_11098/g.41116  ORF Transcript_11098/g.41116 Transcript_11098/m.41116 type:complete len:427 (+) Transcript_11098:2756-4036(+)
MALIAFRSACGWFNFRANRAAFSWCPLAAAFESACAAPVCFADTAAASSNAACVASFHNVSLASAPPVAMKSPSASVASAHALSSCASIVATCAPCRTPHSINNPSPPVDSSCVPDVTNRRANTAAVCPSRVRRHAAPCAPAVGSTVHSLMTLSPPAVATTLSVGENATAQTPLLCPRYAPAGTKSGRRHNRAVRSPEHVAPKAPFGAMAVQFTDLSCAIAAAFAGRDIGSSPGSHFAAAFTAAAISHTRATLSAPPDSAIGAPPRCANATAATAPTCPSPIAKHRHPALFAVPARRRSSSPLISAAAAGVRSHNRTVWSRLPVMTSASPHGPRAASRVRIAPACPVSATVHAMVFGSNTRNNGEFVATARAEAFFPLPFAELSPPAPGRNAAAMISSVLPMSSRVTVIDAWSLTSAPFTSTLPAP